MSSSNDDSHVEHHHHGHNYAEANREFFNKEAGVYDDRPVALEVAKKCAQAMLKAFDFDEEKTYVLDYACGTGEHNEPCHSYSIGMLRWFKGLISRELAPFSKQILGVDISQGMVDQYNLRVANQGIPSEEMKAVATELKGEQGELENRKFDVVVVSIN